MLWFVLAGVFGAGILCVAYGVFVERTWFRVGRYRLDILPGGASGPISVLHLSDLHFIRRERRKARFLAGLAQPDVAVVTGDLLGEPEAVETVVSALRPIRGRLFSDDGSRDCRARRHGPRDRHRRLPCRRGRCRVERRFALE